MDNFSKLKEKIRADRGFDFDKYGQEYVKRRLNARMMALAIERDNWDSYYKVIEKDKKEYQYLFDAFSINVTEFFRDASLWEELRAKYFPQVIAAKKADKSTTLRVWSAACSSGDEPYSIAMAFQDLIPRNLSLSIIATDIDDDALAKAQNGIYFKESLKNVQGFFPEFFKKHFTSLSTDEQHASKIPFTVKYKISDEIKRMVTFKKHNMLTEQPIAQADIIFCRNVMIYFTPQIKENILEVFWHALVDKGMLVIGKSEIIFSGKGREIFTPLEPREHIYVKEHKIA